MVDSEFNSQFSIFPPLRTSVSSAVKPILKEDLTAEETEGRGGKLGMESVRI